VGSVMESSAGRRNSGSVAHDDGMHEEDEEECHGGKYCAVVPLTMAGIGVMSSGCTKCVTTCVTSVNLCVCVHICLVDYQVCVCTYMFSRLSGWNTSEFGTKQVLYFIEGKQKNIHTIQ